METTKLESALEKQEDIHMEETDSFLYAPTTWKNYAVSFYSE